jgi:hypothetical protein
MIREFLGRLFRRDAGVVLTSSDGAFKCTGEHAVELAYMISNMEADAMRCPDNCYDLGGLMVEYLEGRKSVDEIQTILREWRKEDEAV